MKTVKRIYYCRTRRLADLLKVDREGARSPLGDRPREPVLDFATGIPDGLVGVGIPDLR